ncbi:hypothetical protein HAALTHF_50840n [Vreelandella aquamarina]|nr:hypothetical protein HAALTHF_50840n [Halomonas axialensis]
MAGHGSTASGGLRSRLVGRSHRAPGAYHLYALLLWLPAFAILRQVGRGGALRFYGMELLPEAEREIPWMIAPPICFTAHSRGCYVD